MKKYILAALIALSTLFGARADAGDISIAPQLAFATKHTMFGMGLQAQFDLTEKFCLAPEFIFYFKNDNITSYNGNVNLHYLMPLNEKFTFYPLAGVSYARYKAEWKEDDGEKVREFHDRVGLNAGAGAEYMINDQMHLFAEERFQWIKDFTQSVTLVGVRFTF